MGINPLGQNTTVDSQCRRRADRIPLPVEIALTCDGQIVKAVIRDVSFESESNKSQVGICIFHNEELPLIEPLACRAASGTRMLPDESQVTLLWTRAFGIDGYLSGGRMISSSENSSQK